jgi:hypothetical protein
MSRRGLEDRNMRRSSNLAIVDSTIGSYGKEEQQQVDSQNDK